MADRCDSRSARILVAYVCLFFTIDPARSSQGSSPAEIPHPLTDDRGGRLARSQNLHQLPAIENGTSFLLDMDSLSNAQLYALLVDVLERLDVLVPRSSSCYQLERIEHGNSSAQTHRVNLVFKEFPITQSSSSGADSPGATTNVTGEAKSSVDGGLKSTPPRNQACLSQPGLVHVHDAQPLVRDSQANNDTHGRRGAERGGGGGGRGGKNGTDKAGGGPQREPNVFQRNGEEQEEEEEEEDDDQFGGLSRTQVVVIATCSAIISTFFIVAFVLRVRNYIKRLREEQQQARRPTFRSCSVRLRSVSHSNEQVRRDSQVSKLSHQSNLTGGRGGGGGGAAGGGGGGSYSLTNGSCTSREHSNASSPRHDTDTKPLLLVTAVTEGSGGGGGGGGGGGPHLPSSNQSSLPPTPSGSQSSSLQYIDEESSSSRGRKTERAVSRALSADDSESRPLLASTEVSANSLHLSPTSPTSISLATPLGEGKEAGTGGGTSSLNLGGPTSLPSAGSASDEAKGLIGPCSPVEGDPGADRKIPEGAGEKSSSAVPEEPLGSLGGEGAGDKVCEGGGSTQVPLIHFCGLTQSDTSLSSTGGYPNYCYGTQTEYTPPDLGYFSTAECINGMNTPYHALHFLRKPTFFGSRSFIPSYSGDPFSPGLDNRGRTYSMDLVKQDSLMSDYGWYDYGGLYSPPPLSANLDNVFSDIPPALVPDVQGTVSSAALPGDSTAADPGACVCDPATGSEVLSVCARNGDNLMGVCEKDTKEESVSVSPVTAAVSSSDDHQAVQKGNNGVAVAQDNLISSSDSSLAQTLPGVKETHVSLAQTNERNHHDQSESPDHLSSQSNASTQSCVGDKEQLEQRLSGDVDHTSPTPASPTSKNTPETTVVMKRLLSSEDERTTFL